MHKQFPFKLHIRASWKKSSTACKQLQGFQPCIKGTVSLKACTVTSLKLSSQPNAKAKTSRRLNPGVQGVTNSPCITIVCKASINESCFHGKQSILSMYYSFSTCSLAKAFVKFISIAPVYFSDHHFKHLISLHKANAFNYT